MSSEFHQTVCLDAFYSELQEGRRSGGGQMKRFSDNVKLLLKKCQIPPSQLEALAADL